MNKTKIEWTDYTWNPITGCLGPSGNYHRCSYCYAWRVAKGRLQNLYLSNYNVLAGYAADPFAPRFWRSRLNEPIQLKKPSRIFVVDMGELLGDWVPWRIIDLIFGVIRCCPQHTFQLLTHQPQNLPRLSPYPKNCHVGITVTGGKLDKPIHFLNQIEATVKFLSIEPLLYPVTQLNLIERLNWIIVGAQTGPGAQPPDSQWVVDLILEAQSHQIPVFLKDNLKWSQRIQQFPLTEGVKV